MDVVVEELPVIESSIIIQPSTDDISTVDLSQVTAGQLGPTILLDSSFLVALFDNRDPNHAAVEGVFGFMKPHNCKFHIPLYVVSEVFSKIVHKDKKVSTAMKSIKEFIKKTSDSVIIGSTISMEDLFGRYQNLARNKVRLLQSNDFIIATEGMLLKCTILTCDYEMYQKVKPCYKQIYYVAAKSKKYKDDIPKFISKLLKTANGA